MTNRPELKSVTEKKKQAQICVKGLLTLRPRSCTSAQTKKPEKELAVNDFHGGRRSPLGPPNASEMRPEQRTIHFIMI